ncbi:unnamed protein product [Phaedon cochleariae]|uniref:Myb/SANT-like DNA-binding domain-containing protein n=1 Tax=Phaedon cochleariae TaxID=80249 RepID=A0A9N9X0R0_PHACE|nr:unnamed protein product [Phaedon cochleariae]
MILSSSKWHLNEQKKILEAAQGCNLDDSLSNGNVYDNPLIHALSPDVDALSPEQIVDMINNATVIFDLKHSSDKNVENIIEEPIAGSSKKTRLDQTSMSDTGDNTLGRNTNNGESVSNYSSESENSESESSTENIGFSNDTLEDEIEGETIVPQEVVKEKRTKGVAKGRIDGPVGKEKMKKLWEQLAQELNALGMDFTYAESLLRHARSQDEHQTPGTSNEAPVQKSLVEENLTVEVGSRKSIEVTTPLEHIWQYNEVITLIRSMECHYEDLAHPKRRRSVFTNVVNDLLSSGFAVDESMCQAKWKNLVRSYNTAKDQKTRTGRGPTRFQFFEELDNLLGEKPTNKAKHTIESSSSNHNNTEEANCVVNVDEVNCTLVIEEDDSDRDKAKNDEIYTDKKNQCRKQREGKKARGWKAHLQGETATQLIGQPTAPEQRVAPSTNGSNEDPEEIGEPEVNNFEQNLLKAVKPVTSVNLSRKRPVSGAEIITNNDLSTSTITSPTMIPTTSQNKESINDIPDALIIEAVTPSHRQTNESIDYLLLNSVEQSPSSQPIKRKRLIKGGETIVGPTTSPCDDAQPSTSNVTPSKLL